MAQNIRFIDRRNEVNTATKFLMNEKTKALVLNSGPGYGTTEFFERLQHLLQGNRIRFYNAELSSEDHDPISEIIRNAGKKHKNFYNSMQILQDEVFGEPEKSTIGAIAEDLLPVGGKTLDAVFFNAKKSIPIYAGNYFDSTRELFFKLIKNESKSGPVCVFIDNIQHVSSKINTDIIS